MNATIKAIIAAAEACAEQLERVGDHRKDHPFVQDVRDAISSYTEKVEENAAERDRLRGALVSACSTIREARLFVEGRSPIRRTEAAALLAGAEETYRKAVNG